MATIRPPDHDFSLQREQAEHAARAAAGRVCDARGCFCPGAHRAPRSRYPEDGYFWFCQRHARQYNRAWNYFRGMSEAEIEAAYRAECAGAQAGWRGNRFRGAGNRHWHGAKRPAMFRAPGLVARRAFAILGLAPGAGPVQVRRRFCSLVKRLHPDSNGGRSANPERLRAVLWAWRQLQEHTPGSRR